MFTYKLLLSSKERVEVKGLDASDAMQKALQRYPETMIRECYSGCKEWHRVHTPVGSYDAPPAWIDYEIPDHSPYTPEEKSESPAPEAMFPFMDELPVIAEAPKPITRKRQVGAKERLHA